MCDNEHAYVFVDNHDNQRGHGGGGNILVCNPIHYIVTIMCRNDELCSTMRRVGCLLTDLVLPDTS